ncbi:MAG: phospholipase D-like domain-containing protein [Candidatus Absconditicoccaceae bacterium]
MKQIRFIWIVLATLFLSACVQIKPGDGYYHNENNAVLRSLSGIQNITGEIYITPGNFQPYYDSLAGAKNGLKIQVYEFTEKRIRNLIINLLKKGTDIKIIIEDKKFQQYRNTYKDLINLFTGYKNIAVKSDKQMGTEYIHSKVDLLDNSFWIKTNNITASAFESSREYMFHSYNLGVKESLDIIFDKDWSGDKIETTDIHPNLIICNINCRAIIEDMLNNAKESIYIQTQYITDFGVFEILKNKSNLSGFQIIVADTDDNDDLLSYFGPAKVKKLKKPYVHAKMILIDNKYLILGSMNLSQYSLDKNREIGIVLIDQSLIDQFKKQFDRDWKNQ